jgi:3-carboxy-cis,cis-muconate cycloisomerase
VASHVHRGATSQDVVDTATMLVARRGLEPLLADLRAAGDACALLAERHRRSLMAGRTLLQQALPITFGLKAAGWLSGLDGAIAELADVRDRVLAVQLGGAAGTLAAYGAAGLDVVADVADQLGLVAPELPWHTVRLRPARLATALGSALGAMAKVGRDVSLLAQTEVAEVAEGAEIDRGGSSTMPHKRNPVASVAVLACAARAPGLVATVLSAMAQEHERAAGGWQAEWETLSDLLRLAGSAAASVRELLEGLEVDTERMRANVAEFVMSESAVGALTDSLGRARANELVKDAARRAAAEDESFEALLLQAAPELDSSAFDPESYLGVTEQLIDRALAAHGSAAGR